MRLSLPGLGFALVFCFGVGLWASAARAGLPLEHVALATDTEAWQPWVAQVMARGEPATTRDGPVVSWVFDSIDCERRDTDWACRFGDLPGPDGPSSERWSLDHDEPLVARLHFWRDLDPTLSAEGSRFVISRVEVSCRRDTPTTCQFLVWPSNQRKASVRLGGGEVTRQLAPWVTDGWTTRASASDVLPWVSATVRCQRPETVSWNCRWSATDAPTQELDLDLGLDLGDPEQAALILLLRRHATTIEAGSSGEVQGLEVPDLRVECHHLAASGDGFCQIGPGAEP